MTNKTETRTIEKEKFFAEKLNGRFAMLGIIAGLPIALSKMSLLFIRQNLE